MAQKAKSNDRRVRRSSIAGILKVDRKCWPSLRKPEHDEDCSQNL